MKKLITALLAMSITTSYAAAVTDMNQKWSCTTNASRATTTIDKNKDNAMEKNITSASAAFAMAAENCRNCTKITCKVSE